MPRNFLPSLRSPKEGNLYGYFLPKALVNLTLSKSGEEISLKINGFKHVPDPDHYYYFKYQPSSAAEDDIVVKYNQNGFLSQVHTQIDDQTDDVIASLADIMGALAATPSPAGKLPPGVTKTKARGLGAKEIFTGFIDPFSEEDLKMLNDKMHNFPDNPKIPKEYVFEAKVLGKPQASGYSGNESDRSGIFCKPRALVEIGVFGPGGKETELIEVPHPNMLEFIEIPTANFVKTEFEITFSKEGYPTYIHINKPSSALALMQVPISILRAIFEIPATIFQFRINMDNMKAQAIKSDYDYRKTVLDYTNKIKDLEQSEQQGGNANLSGAPQDDKV